MAAPQNATNGALLLQIPLLHFRMHTNPELHSAAPMPKVEQDRPLQSRLQEFVAKHGSVRSAAQVLGVNHASLGRFLESGMAIAGTRREYSAALEREAAKSGTTVAVPVADVAVGGRLQLAERELRQIRRTCESVLALLDAYEGR
jgi:hypothetical protein